MRVWSVFMAYESKKTGFYDSTEWYCRNKKEALKKKAYFKRVVNMSNIIELSVKPIEIPRNKDGVIKALNNDF